MVKISKKVVVITGAVFGIVVVVGAFTTMTLVSRQKISALTDELSYQQGVVASLNTQIQDIGSLTTVFELKYDVMSGTIIEEQDLVPVQMPLKSAGGFVTDINQAVGSRYKTYLKKGDLLTESLAYPNDLKGDLRYIDLVCDQLPIGLKVGDYVDIRFQFSMGQDFIAMEHKEVIAINGNVIKIVGDAGDVHTEKSMRTDKKYYVGCQIYALQYVDGGIQNSAKVFYPMRYEELNIIAQDPNLADDYDFSKYYMVDRDEFEGLIISQLRSKTNTVDEELAALIEQGVQDYQKSMEAAKKAYEAQQGGGTSSSTGTTDTYTNSDFGVQN